MPSEPLKQTAFAQVTGRGAANELIFQGLVEIEAMTRTPFFGIDCFQVRKWRQLSINKLINIAFPLIHFNGKYYLLTPVYQKESQKAALFQLLQEQVRVVSKHLPLGYTLSQAKKSTLRYSVVVLILRKKKKDPVEAHSDDSARGQRKKGSGRNRNKKKVQAKGASSEGNELRIPKNISVEQEKCYIIFIKLRNHPLASNFFKLQENPLIQSNGIEYIDLGTIQNTLKARGYQSILQFWADVRKVWQYSYVVSQKGSAQYQHTAELENFFNELYREVESPHYRFDIDALEMKVDLLNREIQEVKGHSGPSNSQKNTHGNHHYQQQQQQHQQPVQVPRQIFEHHHNHHDFGGHIKKDKRL